MAQQIDASSKSLFELSPSAWLALAGVIRPAELIEVIAADLSTITALADRVFLIKDPQPWILNVELQGSYDRKLPARMAAYNTALHVKHEMPVVTVVILLAPRANASNLTGELHFNPPVGAPWMFAYNVIRIWEIDADRFLDEPSLLPLTLIAKFPSDQLISTTRKVRDRLASLEDGTLAKILCKAIEIFLGLRYDKMTVEEITRMLGYDSPMDSPTVQVWMKIERDLGREEGREEGRAVGLHQSILRIGTARIGLPSPAVQKAIERIGDVSALELLLDRVLDAKSWEELTAP